MTMKEIKTVCAKEIERMAKVIKNVKLKDKKGKELLNLAKAYYNDSIYFYSQKQYVNSFEAVVISWAYIDSGLHLGIFEVPQDLKEIFTV